jgi:deazaflavin-dependent oxidoreductase (nitroreductase family)
MIDDAIRAALQRDLTCDITTTGRKSGTPRRLEIWYFMIDDQVYITGTPGRRDWLANLQANPLMTFHVKEGARADLPARARVISASDERRQIMGRIMRENSWFAAQQFDLDEWVAGSPLVAVDFE